MLKVKWTKDTIEFIYEFVYKGLINIRKFKLIIRTVI